MRVKAANENGGNYGDFTFTVNDGTTNSAAADMTINVRAVNDAPVLTTGADELTVDENVDVDTDTAITFSVTDEDDTAHSFRVFEGSETESVSTSFAVVGRSGAPTLVLLAGNGLDYEAEALDGDPTIPLRVVVSDGDADDEQTDEVRVTVTVRDANDAPVLTSSGAAGIEENVGVRTVTGVTFSVSDQDGGDTHSFTVYEDAALTTVSTRFAVEDVGEAGSQVPTLVLLAGNPLDHEAAEVVDGKITLHVVAADNNALGAAASGTVAVEVAVEDANDAPTGVPTVTSSGGLAAPKAGDTLTADADGIADEDGLGAFAWQWQSSADGAAWADAAGPGADSAAYELTPAEAGRQVRVVAGWTDGGGAPESVESAPTVAVAADAVFNAVPDDLRIAENADGTGSAVNIGSRVTATDANGDPITYSLDTASTALGFAIDPGNGQISYAGAGLDYEAQAAHTLTVVATSIGADGTPTGVQQEVTVRVVNIVEATEDTDYAFEEGDFGFAIGAGAALASVTIRSLTLPAGASLRLNSSDVAADDVIPVGQIGNLVFTPAANANGAGYAGFAFTANDGAQDSAEEAMRIDVAAVNDAPVLAASGTASIAENVAVRTVTGVTFSVSDQDSADTHTFTVYEDEGLTAASIRFAVADEGESGSETPTLVLLAGNALDHEAAEVVNGRITLYVVARDGSGAGNAASEKVAVAVAVEDENDPPTGAPVITGTLEVGETLTADTAAVRDEDGLGGFAWQWQSRASGGGWGNVGAGTDSATYELTSAEDGRQMRVVVSWTDGGGAPESAASEATAAVADPTPPTPPTPVNTPPTATGSTIVISEDGSHVFAAADFGFADSDSGDRLASVAIAALPSSGALALDGAPVSAGDVIDAGDIDGLVFTPAAGESGSNYGDFTFTVNDGREDSAAATMTMHVADILLYENHPLNKHVYDADPEGTLGGTFTLAAGAHDNDLFTVDAGGRLWWRAMPDYEAPGDGNGDNVYRVRISHLTDGGETTHSHIDVAVQDILLEEDDTSYDTRRATGTDYFTFRPGDIPDEEEPTGLVRHLITGHAFVMPATGPLVLTWSFADEIEPPFQSLLDTQADYDKARDLMERALAEFEATANIRFIEVGADDSGVRGDIRVNLHKTTDPGAGASGSASFPGGGGAASNHIVVVTPSFHDEFLYGTLIHELGHALGLHHPFETQIPFVEGNSWPGDDELYRYSTDTVMSYARRSHYEDAGLSYNTSLHTADIEALRFLYGAPGTDWQSPERFFTTSPASRIKFPENAITHIEVDENIDVNTAVHDHDGGTYPAVRFELQAGLRDNDLFTISSAGQVFFRESPDFENPHDGPNDPKFGGDNIYEVEYRAYWDTGNFFGDRDYLLIEVQDVVLETV